MVNFKKLSARAQQAKDAIDQQGGSAALKEKAERARGIARGKGSAADKAKAAADLAREKPKPEDKGQ